jgi:hypothetical protein
MGKCIQAEATRGQSGAQECIVSNIDDFNMSWKVHIAFPYKGVNCVAHGNKGKSPVVPVKKTKPASKGKQFQAKKVNHKAKKNHEVHDATFSKDMECENEINAAENKFEKDTKKRPFNRGLTSPINQAKMHINEGMVHLAAHEELLQEAVQDKQPITEFLQGTTSLSVEMRRINLILHYNYHWQ